MFGGIGVTGGAFMEDAETSGIRVKIISGEGVCADKVAERADRVIQSLVDAVSRATLSGTDSRADFAKQHEQLVCTGAPLLHPPATGLQLVRQKHSGFLYG